MAYALASSVGGVGSAVGYRDVRLCETVCRLSAVAAVPCDVDGVDDTDFDLLVVPSCDAGVAGRRSSWEVRAQTGGSVAAESTCPTSFDFQLTLTMTFCFPSSS